MDLQLKDRVAIVTGSTGICKVAALSLAGEGKGCGSHDSGSPENGPQCNVRTC